MTNRCLVGRALTCLAVLLAVTAAAATAAPPVLVSAVSRLAHGAAGNYDVQLPLTGNSGIECRSIANGVTLVFTFDQTVKSGGASVTAGGAVIGTPAFATNTMTVPLTGLTNGQSVTVTLTNVANDATAVLPSQDVTLRTLFADVNGDGILTGTDANLCRSAVGTGAAVNGGNFRCDVNADGIFTGSDANQSRAAVGAGASVDGGPTANTAPTISTVPAQSAVTGVAMQPAGFTVGDAESDPGTLVVSWTSSDQVTVPNSSIAVSGVGASRAITLTPSVGVTSAVPVTITLYVSDGLAYSSAMAFVVTVTPPPITYLATLGPVAGTGSLGSGTGLLTVSGDQTSAVVSYTVSNLSGPLSEDAVHDSTGAVLFDIAAARNRGLTQPDGSFKWTFDPAKKADIMTALQGNSATLLLETAAYPAGELSGVFKPINGSQTFTPPAAPPSIAINPPTKADASRFLQQAAFGGNFNEITALANPSAANASTAINDWLTAQFNTPLPISPTYAASSVTPPPPPLDVQSATQPYSTSSMYWQLYNRVSTPQNGTTYGDTLIDDRIHEMWWKNAVTAPDPLRQRVATALSEIFVVSENDGTVDGNLPGLASYYDMLADDAFGNFRTLLGDVTLHPIMGKYLNMKGNKNTAPNENYAREIMQLFSIGLYMLQPDGTLMLDSTGRPIPTYTQPVVTSFAQVYTGWEQNSPAKVLVPQLIAPVAPATQPTVTNFTSYYQQPMIVTASSHSTGAKTLLTYPGAAVIPPATAPGMIAANAKQTTATANAELNAALDNLFNHPNVGPFICRQLIQRLVESNPSPAYVYRVAQVFNNDGAGVRGNMKAVLAAILTDYEARSPDLATAVGYGHMREPILRFANLLHSCNAVSKSGKWLVGKSDNNLQQTVFRSPTVFNFFDPSYAQPGGIQSAGIVSPEFDIIYETTITNAQNILYTGIYAGYNADGSPKLTGTGFRFDAYGSDVYLDLSAGGANLVPLETANPGGAMLNQVVLLLSGTPLDPAGTAQARIQQFLATPAMTTGTTGTPLARVQAAVHLVVTSPQCAAQR